MGIDDYAEIYKCEFCDNEISTLTKKLQKHSSSYLWTKHGRCCASCTSAEDIVAFNKKDSLIPDFSKLAQEGRKKNDTHRTNILLALSRANEFERQDDVRKARIARKVILVCRTISVSAFGAGLIFFYYENSFLTLAGFLIGIISLLLCQLAVWSKNRNR